MSHNVMIEVLITHFFQVMVEEEDWVYPELSFIAEFGGALGMFLGFSFYMFWDLGEFALKRCSKSNVEAMGQELK